jgi:hypothetical protein
MSQLDEPSGDAQVGSEHGYRASELALLKRVDEGVDESDEGERERETEGMGVDGMSRRGGGSLV